MYLVCNSRIHVITLYSGYVCVYYASLLRCWQLVWILVRTDHPFLGVGCHKCICKCSDMLGIRFHYYYFVGLIQEKMLQAELLIIFIHNVRHLLS
jgi:hypothetical protein